ncbi:protein spire isoform X1 [Spodoptera litura]|uniref:Protein spire isoform X1 n=1 Tax=Spodoptera litura TaxID=69820 RepID=A0A9J7DXM2_SPOLT|nr:protein spire isoform X1 [Spodoptera litura]
MMRKENAGAPGGTEFSLDASDCITLQQILQAFNSTISEEHAWALFYQAARCFQKCMSEGATCYLATEPRHVLLHKDGTVHPTTLLNPGDDSSREEVTSEQQLVVNLALVIYHALDYTHSEDEERLISPDLEGLITEMTACDTTDDDEECGALSEGSETSECGRADTDDEGIERDSEPAPRRRRRRRRFMLKDVIERCVWHCGGGGRCAREAAAAHYRAVCRALVAEALELASFLARVRVGGARDMGAAEDSAAHLDTLRFSDWSNRRIWRALQARFWMQVIGELRMGVKLKKVNYSRTPIEYELTPYEILMDDIRSRRYTLRKVDGAIPPSVKKDAHAMILEFIRSRPPLKKASDRKLPPPRREVTPREKLLASIQVGRQLRPTPYSRRLSTSGAGSGPGGGDSRRGGDVTPHAQPQRRLIKVDFDNLEDDEDEDDTETCTSPEVCAPQPFPRHTAPQQQTPKPWKRTEEPPRAPPRTRISHDEYHQFCDQTLESYDLATQCPSRRASMRRHTVTHTVCPTTIDGAHSLPHSRPGSRASCAGAASLASSDADAQLGELSWSRSSLQDELIKSVSGSPNNGSHKQWQDAIMSDDRLSLTLEEIVHIRSVLTKAELEVLPVEGRVKEDVEKRRVCFLCLKTRFGIFGPWGQKCKLCKKTVCQKCCSKMRIPTEHFAHVPVVLLSPSLLPSPEDEAHSSFPRSLMSRLVSPEYSSMVENSVGSAPSSPAAPRRAPTAACGGAGAAAHSAPGSRGGSALGFSDQLSVPPHAMSRSVDGPQAMSLVNTPPSTLDRRARYGRSTTGVTAAERLRGVQMAVCHDCKAMVLQIIKSSRASRSASRDRALRHLTLDLAPVYTADC